MTPDEADQRIIVSRGTLVAYIQGIQQTGVYPIADLPLVHEEICLLEAIAEKYPSRGMQVLELVTWWTAFEANVRGKMN